MKRLIAGIIAVLAVSVIIDNLADESDDVAHSEE